MNKEKLLKKCGEIEATLEVGYRIIEEANKIENDKKETNKEFERSQVSC